MILLPPLSALVAAILATRLPGHRHAGSALVAMLVATVVAALWTALVSVDPLAIPFGPVTSLHLATGGFTTTMLVLVPSIAAPIIAHAWVTEVDHRRSLIPLLLLFVAVMELLVLSRDLLMLLIAWELVGLLSWLLIGSRWRDASRVISARTAFVTTRIGDLGLYVAAGILFAATGTFRYDAIVGLDRPAADLVAAGILFAAAAKSAQVPFGQWLFAAMAGPTPVSALLHSATLVAAGAYLLIIVSPLLAAVPWILPATAGVGLVTVLAGGMVASLHREAKPALAGSTSAQYGLMFIAVGAGAPAIAGAQLVVHAVYKSLLFLGAGVAMHERGSGVLAGMRLGRRRPVAAAASIVGLVALAALPLTAGGWTKEAIVAAAEERSPLLGILVVVSGALTAFYAARLALLMWAPATAGTNPASRSLRAHPEDAALLVLAAATLALSVLWLPGGAAWLAGEEAGFGIGGIAPALLALTLGGATALVLDRDGRLWAIGGPGGAWLATTWLGAIPRLQHGLASGTLRLADALARFDARVVDAGVRGASRVGLAVSRIIARRDELTVDGAVRGIAQGTLILAEGSRRTDERGVDGAVEATGMAVGRAGHESRRLQTGMSHEYLQLVAAGLAVALLLLVVAR